jgi:hypothetical protein
MKTHHGPLVPTGMIRRVAVSASADPRSVQRELREPGSVRGMAGDRIRRALHALDLSHARREESAA